MSAVSIRVDELSKMYTIGAAQDRHDTLRDGIASGLKRALGWSSRRDTSTTEFWALKDVSFEIDEGGAVGIIGRNGAGKSTLLKILSRITTPTAGRAEIHGRVGSLLEVGTGFHGELTGRENVYLNGAILGMRKTGIDRRFDEIVDFADVGRFLDTPVKYYSTGMHVRLAFAVAAHLEPQILIVDEVLAVGDARFQRKCLNKMQDAGKQGRTVVFVSHNMAAVARLCERVILLESGAVKDDGPSPQVISRYLSSGLFTAASRHWPNPADAPGEDIARLRAVRVLSEDGQVSDAIDIRCPVRLQMEYEVITPGTRLMASFTLYTEEGVEAFSVHDVDPTWRRRPRPVGRYMSTVTIPGNFLAEGQMFVAVGLVAIDPFIGQFFERDVVSFQIFDGVDGDSARGDYGGHMVGVVRPLLPWKTEQV